MKMTKKQSPIQNRRRFLAALLTFPLLLSSIAHGREKKFLAIPSIGADGFVIVNGWVMLKQDITGYKE